MTVKTLPLLMMLCALAACSGNSTATSRSAATSPSRDATKRRGPGASFLASAPPGMSLNDLGRPFTADFRRLQGPDGQGLFPKAGPAMRTPQHVFEHDVDTIESEEELAANAGAWNIGLSHDERRSNRYASLRVLEIDDVHEIDDTTAMKRAPRDAEYYPWRIYMGRSYEVVLEGTSESFNAGVRADLLAFSGDITNFADDNELRHTVLARGLAPRNDRAIFSRTTTEIEARYRATVDEPVPIIVEWRRIPGRKGQLHPIEWLELRKGCAGDTGCEPCHRWRFERVEVGIPARKRDGRAWDADGSTPDVVLTLRAAGDIRTSTLEASYRRSWTLSPAVTVDAGTLIQLRAIDKDLMADDPIFTLSARPTGTLRGGTLEFGSGSATAFATCIDGGGTTPGRRRRLTPRP